MAKKNKFSYSVVLPVYKEYRNLNILLPNLLKIFNKIKKTVEIIVVDDNSQDGTKELIIKLQKQNQPVKLIERKKERGFISALIQGTNETSYNTVVHMDADLAHDPADLEKMISVYETHESPTVVVGSRYISGSNYRGKPVQNQLFGRLGSLFCRFFLGLSVIDVSNNFRIFPSTLWKSIVNKLDQEGNVVLVEELILMKKTGAQFVELPTTYIERRFGESKLQLIKETARFFKALPVIIKHLI